MLFLKYFYTLILLLLFNNQNILSGGGELWIHNHSSSDIWVHVYPVSMVFNNDTYGTNGRNYCLLGTSKVFPQQGIEKYFINGANENEWYFKISVQDWIEWGFDGVPGTDAATKGTIGFGRWKIDFYNSANINGSPIDYCILEYDLGYVNPNRPECGSQPGDVNIRFVNENPGHPRVQFLWETCSCLYSTPYQDVPTNRKIYERDRGCPGEYWEPEIGNFKWNSGSPWNGFDYQRAPNLYTIFPQDPRVDITEVFFPYYGYINQNNEINDVRFGTLTLKLTIEKNEPNGNPVEIKTPNIPYDYAFANFPPIVIDKDANLILAKGNNSLERKITFRKYYDFLSNTPLEIFPYGTLELQGSANSNEKAHMYFESYSHSVIWQNANLIMGQNSAIDLQGNSFM
ncbi:MAG: hypothetical protein IAE91_14310, partial [Ignavibacteriaceae bacterium]|nr:hypothetical protein [Ignavibacteriaceae bacterium]